MKPKKNKSLTIPAELVDAIESEIDSIALESDRELAFDAKRTYVYVYAEGKPLCRLKYTGDFAVWEFAIFKWSTESFSSSEFGFLPRGTIHDCVFEALNAYPKIKIRIPFFRLLFRVLIFIAGALLYGVWRKLVSLFPFRKR